MIPMWSCKQDLFWAERLYKDENRQRWPADANSNADVLQDDINKLDQMANTIQESLDYCQKNMNPQTHPFRWESVTK